MHQSQPAGEWEYVGVFDDISKAIKVAESDRGNNDCFIARVLLNYIEIHDTHNFSSTWWVTLEPKPRWVKDCEKP